MRLLIVLVLIVLAGCSTRGNYKGFDLPEAEENLGVVIGRVDVRYDNAKFDPEECRFCIRAVCPQLLDRGYVFMSLKQGEVGHASLSCYYPKVGYKGHLLRVIHLNIKPGIVYFGNLIVNVKFGSSHTYKNPNYVPPEEDSSEDYYNSQRSYGTSNIAKQFASHLMKDTAEGIIDLFTSDYTPETITDYNLPATVSVEDDMADVVDIFRKQVEKEDIQVEKNLIDIKWVR